MSAESRIDKEKPFRNLVNPAPGNGHNNGTGETKESYVLLISICNRPPG